MGFAGVIEKGAGRGRGDGLDACRNGPPLGLGKLDLGDDLHGDRPIAAPGPPAVQAAGQAVDQASPRVEDFDRAPCLPGQGLQEDLADISVMRAGEAGIEGSSGGKPARRPGDAFPDEAGDGRRIRVFVDDAGQTVAGLGDDAAGIRAAPGQAPEMLAGTDRRPGPEEDEPAGGVAS